MTSRFISDDECKRKYTKFNEWIGLLNNVKYKFNHDRLIQHLSKDEIDNIFTNCTVLNNTLIEIDGLNIFGSPLSSGTSNNKAFQDLNYYKTTEETLISLSKKLDIMILHGPNEKLHHLIKPKAYIFGHLHCFYGIKRYEYGISINRSIMNGDYNPFNLPVVFDISKNNKLN